MVIAIRRGFMPLLILLSLSVNGWCTGSRTLMIYGDSLSAAYGLELRQGWVSLLTDKLRHSHPQWQVVNLSISGETTAAGLSRLPAALSQHKPDLVVLQLGANDGLRGTPLQAITTNLESMLTLLSKQQIATAVVEMHIPPNYGPVYTRRFNAIFHTLADKHGAELLPFLLEGVAGQPQLNQPDGIHPTADAQPRILNNIWPSLQPLLNR